MFAVSHHVYMNVSSHASGMALVMTLSVCVGPPHENISTAIEWIAKKCCTDINNTQRMNPSDFGDPLTFPLASPWQYFIIGWITMTFGTDILVPLRKLNCNNFSDHYFVPHRS